MRIITFARTLLAAALLMERGPERPWNFRQDAWTSRANGPPVSEPHPVRTTLRARRAANARRNFATGHWQHRVIDAVKA